jgi:hypothetical protein
MLAAENSGLEFSSMPTKVMGGEVIEILDDDEEEAINEYVREEILMKVEPDQKEGSVAGCSPNHQRGGT